MPTALMPHSPPAPARRHLLATLAMVAVASSVGTGCGFKLSQPPRMAFSTVTLVGFAPNSALATELARALEASGVEVVETTAQAATRAASGPAAPVPGASPLERHAVLESLTDRREEVVASTTAFGQVRDMSLRTRFKFQLLRADGSVVLPPTELALARDVTFNEKDALAKQNEFEALHRAMQSDLVEQTLRRLAVISPTQLARP